MKTLKERYESYLESLGYSVTTPSGLPSTVYDYSKRVAWVCEAEGMSWQSLSDNIGRVVRCYDIGGNKEAEGRRSHNAVINALKRYWDFIEFIKVDNSF